MLPGAPVNALAVAESPVLTDDAASMRRFLSWTAAYPHERAEAVNALARAYLHCDLQPEARAQAEIALTRALDDPEPLVRRAMAEAFAGARRRRGISCWRSPRTSPRFPAPPCAFAAARRR